MNAPFQIKRQARHRNFLLSAIPGNLNAATLTDYKVVNNTLVSVRRVTELNAGRTTAGVDGKVVNKALVTSVLISDHLLVG